MTGDDMDLLRAYATEQSEAAFSALVSRHAALVHSSAMRRLGDAHLAEDVTQAVFVILARKAGSIAPGTVLSGWLYRTTQYACADIRKRDIRRQRREQEAVMEAITENNAAEPAWLNFAPVLDETMARLRNRDRDALVLRFFENKSVKEIADALGLEERAAQKRVQRALEKLRRLFARRGINYSAAVIAGAISANSVHAAPASVLTLASAACVGRTTSPSVNAILRGTLKAMAWAKFKFAVSVASVILAASAATVVGWSQLSAKTYSPPVVAAVTTALSPGPTALIVVGLVPADAPEPVDALAKETKENLMARGFQGDHVVILAGQVTRDVILQKLHELAGSAQGEFWLVLLGQSGKTLDGEPTFQVSGPRLTATDIKTALDAIPSRQFVFIGTGNSGGFLPILRDGRRAVLSATQAEGEPDQPRFLSAWVKEFAARPKAPLAEIAARAEADVGEICQQANMAQSEHAQLADPATGKILDAPFGLSLSNHPAATK